VARSHRDDERMFALGAYWLGKPPARRWAEDGATL